MKLLLLLCTSLCELECADCTVGIDILVNIVGGLVARRSLWEMDESFFEDVMRLNVTSTLLTTKSVVPYMGNGSSIINFSSLAWRDGGSPGAAAYAASKGAVMTFARAPEQP